MRELREFEVQSKLEIISKSAFESTSIEKLSIPSSVKIIDNCAFDSCQKLNLIEFQPNSQLKTIGSSAFNNTQIK